MSHLFYLKQNDLLLGTLTVTETNQPWFFARFEPTNHFQAVKSLFDQELELAKAENWQGLETMLEKITEAGCYLLKASTNAKVTDFILYIEDGSARFRY